MIVVRHIIGLSQVIAVTKEPVVHDVDRMRVTPWVLPAKAPRKKGTRYGGNVKLKNRKGGKDPNQLISKKDSHQSEFE